MANEVQGTCNNITILFSHDEKNFICKMLSNTVEESTS